MPWLPIAVGNALLLLLPLNTMAVEHGASILLFLRSAMLLERWLTLVPSVWLSTGGSASSYKVRMLPSGLSGQLTRKGTGGGTVFLFNRNCFLSSLRAAKLSVALGACKPLCVAVAMMCLRVSSDGKCSPSLQHRAASTSHLAIIEACDFRASKSICVRYAPKFVTCSLGRRWPFVPLHSIKASLMLLLSRAF